MKTKQSGLTWLSPLVVIAIFAVALVLLLGVWRFVRTTVSPRGAQQVLPAARRLVPSHGLGRGYSKRLPLVDISGFSPLKSMMPEWKPDASLEEISAVWNGAGRRVIQEIDKKLVDSALPDGERILWTFVKFALLNSEGESRESYELLEQLRPFVQSDERIAREALASLIYYQGVAALRRGEDENCIMCRGDSSSIIPISPKAVHIHPEGSRIAIKHFTEYLDQFPDDLEVSWLLNLAWMTLGEYPDRVDPRFRIDLRSFFHSEFDIGKFRDVSHLVGVNRFNQSGGAIMDDFDNDGLLDIVFTSFDPTQSMSYFRNSGDSKFVDRSKEAGVANQLGGLVCYQADYDNDGWLDIVIPRAAWLPIAIRPTLLRNDGAGGFTDVTREAGLLAPLNSSAAAWADYDNDGRIDLFIACERQNNCLYQNIGNGKFVEVAARAGVQGGPQLFCKGCAWIDYDNDDYPDLFVDSLAGPARLYHNARDGTFIDVTLPMGIDGPIHGFACWSWDFDNDGWLDIFATCYDRTLGNVVKGLLGEHDPTHTTRLYRNVGGKGFVNETTKAGLDIVFATMGCNFGDFDNDGFLDMYLGTGEPSIATLIPNRMFKNVAGERFSEITASSGTGLLQKGHGVACGDWDRDGDVDIFAQTGGATNGDKYHNVLFQNPGQGNHWLTVKLVGKKSNRAAIGARIKVVTAGEKPLTVYRHVSSGSSFGGNPLQQTIGLGKAARMARIEVHWPTSGTTQVFRDIPADQAIEITEFAESFRPLNWKPLPQPQ
jgi:hypothetical protein